VKILFVAYPLLAVTEHSAGGAEQVLWTLEGELFRRGVETWTAASDGSRVAGRLIETGAPATVADQLVKREQEHYRHIFRAVTEHRTAGRPFDLIHDMSGSFWRVAEEMESPVLATLHLARCLYPANSFVKTPKNVRFNCVSRAQIDQFCDLSNMLPPVANGIALNKFAGGPVTSGEREYVLWLGRICEEKGPHHALDVAYAAGERIILAGVVYPFLYHQKFHAREVLPRLRREKQGTRFIDSPSFEEKLSLMRNAKALLLTSTVDETSSLVAMEAAACGTPVIALRRGAIPEVVCEGTTGLLADDFTEMQALLERVGEIHPEECQRYAVEHYSAAAMADRYERLYRLVTQ
jgi:glycosyltransferase involved in cell wall biosynthesis